MGNYLINQLEQRRRLKNNTGCITGSRWVTSDDEFIKLMLVVVMETITRSGNIVCFVVFYISFITYCKTNVDVTSARLRLSDSAVIGRSGNTSTTENVEDQIIKINRGQHVAGDLLEGDILYDPSNSEDRKVTEVWKTVEETKEQSEKRQATREMTWLWHDKKVPYIIHPNLDDVRNTILNAIRTFNTKTCVKFVPKSGGERDYILFDKRQGCFSRIGRSYYQPGEQVISIGDGCAVEGIIIHEMLHAVGFYHEQSRPDRKTYLKIYWENIAPGFENQFDKYSHHDIDLFGINYNYKSVMHYGKTAFSKSFDLPTLEAINDKDTVLGGWGMSPEDVAELDALYRCTNSVVNSWTNWGSYSPCDGDCFKRRQRFCYGSTLRSCGDDANQYGVNEQVVKCSTDECPVPIDSNWSRWSAWSACSRSCDDGYQTRTRLCNNPEPKHGGKQCVGDNHNIQMCRKPRCVLGPYDTDFRDGKLKIWYNNIFSPGLLWMIGSGPTPTERTGPPYDHTNKTGYYLYLESSRGRAGDTAQLNSTQLSKTFPGQKCLKFYYHMFGLSIGSLTLYLTTVTKQDQIMFQRVGNQGNRWNSAQVTLNTTSDFHLTFQGKINDNGLSDIAIDDVFLDDGSCDCQDRYRASCQQYLHKGECIRNFNFMFQVCRRTCNFCGCRDNYNTNDCSHWAKIGECRKNFPFMFHYCQLSCRFCDCRDNARYTCKQYAKTECERNPIWMEVNCPERCENCGCRDKNVNCALWKSYGECTRNRAYMTVSCPKSCHICTPQI